MLVSRPARSKAPPADKMQIRLASHVSSAPEGPDVEPFWNQFPATISYMLFQPEFHTSTMSGPYGRYKIRPLHAVVPLQLCLTLHGGTTASSADTRSRTAWGLPSLSGVQNVIFQGVRVTHLWVLGISRRRVRGRPAGSLRCGMLN